MEDLQKFEDSRDLFVDASATLLETKGLISAQLAFKLGPPGVEHLGLSFTKTAGANRIYFPGQKIGAVTSKSLKLPVFSTLGKALGVGSLLNNTQKLGNALNINDPLATVHYSALIATDLIGFVPGFRLVPLAASVVDITSQ